jgi:hypothetical protein
MPTVLSVVKTGRLAIWATALAILCGCGNGSAGLVPNPARPVTPPTTGQVSDVPGSMPGAIDHGPAAPTRVVLRNLRYRVGPRLAIDVPAVDGSVVPVTPGAPIVMDDVRSFGLSIDNGAFKLDEDNMTSLMTDYIFNYPDAPLKDLGISLSEGRVTITGKLKMIGLSVPFEMSGAPKVRPTGKIEIVPDRIKAMGIPADGLMKLIGLQMQKLVHVQEGRGLTIEGNALVLDCTKLLPPPAISGRATAVSIGADPKDQTMKLTIVFGGGPQNVRDENVPSPQATNYMHLLGGTVRFVNTFDTFTNLQIVDAEPDDPFDFYLAEYGPQMLNGIIVLSPKGWTLSVMPDYLKRNKPLRPKLPPGVLPGT